MDPSDPEPAYILVVEDECLIRMNSAEMLIDAGYAVLEASNADEAIAILERLAPQVQLLFSDIDMPGSIDGLALAAHVQTCWPAVLVLLTSGHCLLTDAQLPRNSRFVPKPYSTETVIRNICDLLSDGR